MIPIDIVDEFAKRAREACGTNVESVILFGSAVAGDFHPGLSNLNLLCILRVSSFEALKALAPVANWWDKQKQPPPLCITRQELERSTDVFTIELLDMQQHHRVIYGEDALSGLQIPMDLHRVQVEYELREKLILLRQHLLLASSDAEHMWNLLLHSLPAFATLFRHAVIAQEQPVPPTKREAIKQLAASLRFDATPFETLLNVREHRMGRSQFEVQDVAARYLAAVEQVTAAVDRMLDSPRAS
jgi:hypothetical protein